MECPKDTNWLIANSIEIEHLMETMRNKRRNIKDLMGLEIAKIRKSKGLSQAKAARIISRTCDISPSNLINAENPNARCKPSLKVHRAILETLSML